MILFLSILFLFVASVLTAFLDVWLRHNYLASKQRWKHRREIAAILREEWGCSEEEIKRRIKEMRI